jgi:dihydrofolate reductase
MEVISVAAVAENDVIGKGNSLPWSLPHEVDRYRERVAGHPVVIGRRTFEMFSDPPGREQIVLSRTERDWDDPRVHHAGGVDDALDVARHLDDDVLYVLGGSAIYEAFLDVADRQLLSRVHGEYDGDATYPEFDRDEWTLADETEYDGYTLEDWVRAD